MINSRGKEITLNRLYKWTFTFIDYKCHQWYNSTTYTMWILGEKSLKASLRKWKPSKGEKRNLEDK
jgi:hypothetical protein